MKRDPLFSPSPSERLVDRPTRGGPWPWRLPSLYLLAFFGGGVAAAAISWWNAGRLGLAPAARRRIAGLGLGYLVASAALLAAVALHLLSLEPAARETLRGWSPQVRSLLQLTSVALAWKLVRLQVCADRLYQIESGGSRRYSSLWGPGIVATLGSLLVLVALVSLGAALRGLAA